jgi:hypothetical protein
MSREDLYDEEGDDEIQPYFVVERPLEELPTFQAHIYRLYSPIHVQERVVTDDISHRMYYGLCSHCSEEHFLGTLVMHCHEPFRLYARVK